MCIGKSNASIYDILDNLEAQAGVNQVDITDFSDCM